MKLVSHCVSESGVRDDWGLRVYLPHLPCPGTGRRSPYMALESPHNPVPSIPLTTAPVPLLAPPLQPVAPFLLFFPLLASDILPWL